MRKKYFSFLGLLIFAIISYAQDISFTELIEIKSTKEFDELMYSNGMRFINQLELCCVSTISEGEWIEKAGRKRIIKGEYTCNNPEPTSEFYEIEIEHQRRFGKNYNSNTETGEYSDKATATIFYRYRETSNFRNYPNFKGYTTNERIFYIQFADKSHFNKFWESIDSPPVYLHTTEFGLRVYSYSESTKFEIRDYDGGTTTIDIIETL